MIKNAQNLHSHTLLSDGKMTHRETLDVAAGSGCSVVAFTDHDTLMPVEVFHELVALNHPTKFISGIELSLADPPGKSKGSYHLIGLFVDPENQALIEHCSAMKQARVGKAKKYAEMFRAHGFNLTVEECLAQAGEGSMGKPHVVAALIAHPENVELLKTHIEKMRVLAETDEQISKDYQEALERSKRYDIGQFVYPIFLRPGAMAVDVTDVVSPPLERGVELIRGAGGLAILAHWHTIKGAIDISELGRLLQDKALDGVETVWGLNAFRTSGEEEMRQNQIVVEMAVERTGALAAPSLDAHEQSDYELLGRSDEFAAQTAGMVERIIERSGVSTKWSTLDQKV